MKRSLLCLMLLLPLSGVQAQSFNATVGGSQIYDAYGLQTDFKWRKLTGWTGMGYNDGVRIGGYLQVPITRNYNIGVGDQMLSGLLDVDEYDTHAFTVRGVSLNRKSETESLQIFTGLLSEETNYPYLHVSNTSGNSLDQTPMAAMLYHRKLSDTLQLHSMTLAGSKLTSIESIGWKPSSTWKFAAAAGVGSGKRYLAARGDMRLRLASLETSYTIAGKDFHRQEQPYYSSEPVGLNARFTYTPIPAVKFSLDHEKSRTYITSLPSVAATIDSASLYASVKGFQVSPTVSRVRASDLPGETRTEMLSISRRLLPRWRAFGAFINMESPTFKQQTVVATNEFRVSSRLAIRQNYSWMNGQNNFSGGVQWRSNRLSFSVDQQVYMSPLATAFGAKSVFQAWTFSVRFRTPHGTSTNINSFIGQDGHLQWGGYLSGLRYNAIGTTTNGSSSFSKYMVRGTVVDERDRGVWGIAVQIGDETALSDSEGEFFIHVKNTRPLSVLVAPDASIQTSRWSLKSAPTTAQGSTESASTTPIRVVVQMAEYLAKN